MTQGSECFQAVKTQCSRIKKETMSRNVEKCQIRARAAVRREAVDSRQPIPLVSNRIAKARKTHFVDFAFFNFAQLLSASSDALCIEVFIG